VLSYARQGAGADEFAGHFHALAGNIERVVIGKREVVELALVCLLAGGHLLVEDVPGVGKTTLARSLTASLGASWQRVQFTPDLLPSDITGVTVYNQATGAFEFHPGPVFANVVLGDEINRASPKTQSALLEVMEERAVTVDGRRRPVPSPFMVIATQNPVDADGTYALPEAQLDRFLMRIAIGYPAPDAEMAILTGTPPGRALEALPAVAATAELAELIEVAARAHVAAEIARYVIRIVAATRSRPDLRLGASPRASLGLLAAARVRAMAAGRGYVVPDDVRALAGPVLAHRLLLTAEAELQGRTGASIMAEVLAGVPVPQPAA
jgi:MoxR-like ATPase